MIPATQLSLDLLTPLQDLTLPFGTRVLLYLADFLTAMTLWTEVEYAYGHTGDHGDFPASSCHNDCSARHEALRLLLGGYQTGVGEGRR